MTFKSTIFIFKTETLMTTRLILIVSKSMAHSYALQGLGMMYHMH